MTNNKVKSTKYYFLNEEKKERALIKALEIGEDSGFIEDFNPDENLKALHSKHV